MKTKTINISGKLAELVKTVEKCPLAGMCYDMDVIEGLAAGELESRVLDTLHAEGDYAFSDEGLDGMFEANEYEFLEDEDTIFTYRLENSGVKLTYIEQ